MSAVKQIVSSLVGVSAVSLYSWSAGTAELEAVDIFNRLTTVVKVDLYLDNNGTSVYLVKSWAIDALSPWPWRGSVPLVSTGQVIKIVSDTAASLDVLGRVTEF